MKGLSLAASKCPVDISLCLSIGQTFGWQKSEAFWLGWDGPNFYRLSDELDSSSWCTGGPTAIERLFDLGDDDPQPRFLQIAPELSPIIARLPGLRLMHFEGAVQSLFSFLCTSNNNLARIEKMVSFLFSLGPVRTMDGVTLYQFPGLEILAEVSEGTLREHKFGYRAATIPMVARELVSRGGGGYLEKLKQDSYSAVISELLSLPGVGHKLADCIALYALGKTEAVPFDVHMWRGYKRLYGGEPDLQLTELRYHQAGDHLREKFGKDAGAAHLFIYADEMRRRSSPSPQPIH